MLQEEHFAILSTFIKLPFVTKIILLSIFEWPFYTGFTVCTVFRHAENLLQLDNGKKIPPKGWKCERCDLTTNLWLNLTDGSILCGRKFFDGSGGNNHALDAYAQTKYPLAVKLGTITPDGAGIVIFFYYPP